MKIRTGVKSNTLTNYNFVRNLIQNEEFGSRRIVDFKTSDTKLFLIKLYQEEHPANLPEKMVDGYIGFFYRDKNGMPEVVMHC